MCAMGRQVPSYHQLCFAHDIQCAVLDAIHKKKQDDQDEEGEVSVDELALLQELSTSLNVVKATIEVLCEENANLLCSKTARKTA
ncbi:unnamed protein product [Parnassius apollo]|uniref:(apollo) hypothetical protein n=1 Tax=Parnassius apollo TaxID=110799 RepID=A0A8S3XR01_PARAO|nr:unnamed protein product [Parnassius apollo]